MHRTALLNTRPRPWGIPALALGLAILLSACGGGGGDAPSASAANSGGGADPTAVPSSALASTQAMTAYIGTLPPDDTQEPLTVGAVMPPVSDTEDPVPL